MAVLNDDGGLPAVRLKNLAPPLPLAVGITAYTLLMSAGLKTLNDGDSYWHIAAGRWMLEHRTVPTLDPFSGSLAGTPWVPHEWLAEIFFALLYQSFSWQGLVAVTAALASVSLGLLTHFLLRWLRPVHCMGVAAVTFLMIAPNCLARPHMLAQPLMVIWVCALSAARAENRSPSLKLLPLMTLWANLHGGFFLGLGVAGALTVETIVEAESGARLRSALPWLRFLALGLLASMISPNGPSGLLVVEKLFAQGATLSNVGEWQVPDFVHGIPPVEIWLLLASFCALYLGLRLPVVRLLMVLGLVSLALRHSRAAEQLGLVAPILAAPFLPRIALAPPALSAAARLRWTAAAGIFGVALAVTLGPSSRPDFEMWPGSAVDFAQRTGLHGKVFNAYPFSGCLLFHGISPYVDSRVELYGKSFLTTLAAAYGQPAKNLNALLDANHIDWTILEAGSAAADVLDHSPGWVRVYSDDIAVVHRRAGDLATSSN